MATGMHDRTSRSRPRTGGSLVTSGGVRPTLHATDELCAAAAAGVASAFDRLAEQPS